jgi:hypothetical protein
MGERFRKISEKVGSYRSPGGDEPGSTKKELPLEVQDRILEAMFSGRRGFRIRSIETTDASGRKSVHVVEEYFD